jgi:putative FmdB family regulatory protein
MPTYEYECKSCSHAFEAFQSMSDAPLSTCPSCGGAVRRLIGGGTGIIFKGSGFYKNDSRKSSSGGSSGKQGSEAPAGAEATSDSSKGDAPKGNAPKGDASKAKGNTDGSSGGKSDGGGKTESKPQTPKAAEAV